MYEMTLSRKEPVSTLVRRPSRFVWITFGLMVLATSLPAAAQTSEEPAFVGAMLTVGADTFEPTIGADPSGYLYFAEAAAGGGVAVGFRAGTRLSKDGGATWTDISPKIAGRNIPPETNDPYIYVDPGTGRVFSFHMAPILTCAMLSFSDNQGQSWTTNPAGCFPTVVWDHQTIVAAKPRGVQTLGYPNVLVQCVNAVYAAMCSRSLDGGMTWLPPSMVHPNTYMSAESLCGAQHGHLTAAPDGTLYLPTSQCATKPTVYVSQDSGLTWTKRVIADIDTPFTDPSVSVDHEGTVYAAFTDEAGVLYLSVSKDAGATWSPAVVATQGITATMPVINVGDPGRIVISYPGTNDLVDGWNTDPLPDPSEEAWGAFMTVSYNALSDAPTFETIEVSGEDPLERRHACVRGDRCLYQVDFIEAIIGPDGRPYASFADGCTSNNCINNPAVNNNEPTPGGGNGVVATLTKMPMPLCELRCPWYGPAPA